MEYKVRFIKTGDVKPAPFNPCNRTDDNKALRILYASMQKKGFLPHHPVILVKGNVIADGHRRWTVARMLEIAEIPYLMADEDLHEVWAENGSQRQITEKEMMLAMRDGLQVVPDGKAGRIEKVTTVIGADGVKLLADNNLSVASVDAGVRIAKYCGKKGDSDFTRKATLWVIKWKNAFEVNHLMRQSIPASLLEEKVNSGAELKFW